MQKISIWLFAAAAFMLPPVHVTTANEDNDPVAFCGIMGELAEAIMAIRQSGTPMSKAMGIASADETFSSVATKLIVAAYDTPQYRTEANQKDAAARFRNDFEVECFKGLME